MAYKIKYRYTGRPSHEGIWNASAQSLGLNSIFEEGVGEGAILDQQRTIIDDTTKEDIIIWSSKEKREEYMNKMITAAGGDPRDDASIWAKITDHTVELVSEEEIDDDDV
tara:strand:+ start:422 stop:751 length:330 start_codon:yes stop_codon:yes gene_type:complete